MVQSRKEFGTKNKGSVMPSSCSKHSYATSLSQNKMGNRAVRDLKKLYSVSRGLMARFPLPNLLLTDTTLIFTFLLNNVFPELLAKRYFFLMSNLSWQCFQGPAEKSFYFLFVATFYDNPQSIFFSKLSAFKGLVF